MSEVLAQTPAPETRSSGRVLGPSVGAAILVVERAKSYYVFGDKGEHQNQSFLVTQSPTDMDLQKKY